MRNELPFRLGDFAIVQGFVCNRARFHMQSCKVFCASDLVKRYIDSWYACSYGNHYLRHISSRLLAHAAAGPTFVSGRRGRTRTARRNQRSRRSCIASRHCRRAPLSSHAPTRPLDTQCRRQNETPAAGHPAACDKSDRACQHPCARASRLPRIGYRYTAFMEPRPATRIMRRYIGRGTRCHARVCLAATCGEAGPCDVAADRIRTMRQLCHFRTMPPYCGCAAKDGASWENSLNWRVGAIR